MATSKLNGVPLPKVANQGGMGSSAAVTQGVKVQSMPSASKPGKTDVKYSKQPSGTRGTNKGAK